MSLSAADPSLSLRVRAKTGEDGRLSLILMEPTPDGLSTTWNSVTTGRMRDLSFHSGSVLHDRSLDPFDQTVALAMVAVAKDDEPGGGRSSVFERTVVGGVLDLLDGGDDTVAHFVRVCGRSSLLVRGYGGPTAGLCGLDDDLGRDKVEAFFSTWPFLLFPLLGKIAPQPEWFGDYPGAGARLPDAGGRLATAVAEAAVVVGTEDGDLPGAVWLVFGDKDTDRAVGEARTRLLLKRLRGVACGPIDLSAVLALALAVAPDWLPDTQEELEAFDRAARTVRGLAEASDGALSPAALVASSKGRWADFLARIDGKSGGRPDISDVDDMVAAFRNQVARPAVANRLLFGSREPFVEDLLRERAARLLNDTPLAKGNAGIDRICYDLLLGGKSLPAVFEASRIWHRDREAMDRSIGITGNVTWPTPFPRTELEDGTVLEPVADSFGLRNEGSALRHCVGGYVDRCQSRSSVIVSIRRKDADGEDVRSSTAELSAWRPGTLWSPEILQHRGLLNAKPPESDAAALAAFVASWVGQERIADGEYEPPQGIDVKPTAIFGARGGPGRDGARGGAGGQGIVYLIGGAPAGGGGGGGGGNGNGDPNRGAVGYVGGGILPAMDLDVDGLARRRREGRGVRYDFGDDLGDGHAVSVKDAAGYDWMDTDALENAFREWSRFLPGPEAARGPSLFLDHSGALLGADLAAEAAALHEEAAARMIRERARERHRIRKFFTVGGADLRPFVAVIALVLAFKFGRGDLVGRTACWGGFFVLILALYGRGCGRLLGAYLNDASRALLPPRRGRR